MRTPLVLSALLTLTAAALPAAAQTPPPSQAPLVVRSPARTALLAVGDASPDFTAATHDGRTVSNGGPRPRASASTLPSSVGMRWGPCIARTRAAASSSDIPAAVTHRGLWDCPRSTAAAHPAAAKRVLATPTTAQRPPSACQRWAPRPGSASSRSHT